MGLGGRVAKRQPNSEREIVKTRFTAHNTATCTSQDMVAEEYDRIQCEKGDDAYSTSPRNRNWHF